MGRPLPPKIAPSRGRMLTPSNTWSLILPDASNQMTSRSFNQFCRAHYCDRPTDNQTDRVTDHATRSVITGRSTAMRPQNTLDFIHRKCGFLFSRKITTRPNRGQNTNRHLFSCLFSWTTWVRRHQRGPTNLDFNETRDEGVGVASAGPHANHLLAATDR